MFHSPSSAARCGGAAVRHLKMQPDANIQSTSAKRMKMKMELRVKELGPTTEKARLRKIKTLDAFAVRRKVTMLKSARETRILKR